MYFIVYQSKMKQIDFWTALLQNTKRHPPRSVLLNSFSTGEEIQLLTLYLSRVRFTLLSFLIHVIIHQIFSFAHDKSRRVTWPNIPQLKLGNVRGYSPIFKTVCVAKNIWRIISTIASFGVKVCSGIYPWTWSVPQSSQFSEQIMSADKYPSIFSHQMGTIVNSSYTRLTAACE